MNGISIFNANLWHMIYPIEGDVRDIVYQTVEIAFFVKEISNQVGNDITDKVSFHITVLRPE